MLDLASTVNKPYYYVLKMVPLVQNDLLEVEQDTQLNQLQSDSEP